MIIAKFIGRIPVLIGIILFAILGVVLIVVGVTATPTGTGSLFIGIVLIVGAAVLLVDLLTTPK